MAEKETFSNQVSKLRWQAEEKTAKMTENHESLSPEETRQMLHELRLHQIEVETQNEELRTAQTELDAARARYFDFYNLAPVGFYTISEQGLILETNLIAADLLGVAQDVLIKQPISRFIHKEDQDIYYLHRKLLFETGKPQTCELRMVKMDGTAFWAHLAATIARDTGGVPVCRVVLSDITERKFREDGRELTARLIVLINTPSDFRKLMSDLTTSLHDWSGCEAVGIRLRAGDDYPYYETRGFPTAFVYQENHLCAYGPDGKILHDNAGKPVLECMCGNILCGRFNPAKPFFTAHGSFWSNTTTALLATTTEADRQARTRNRCNGMGYESVALIPLRAGHQVFGLLQFNDHRPNRFTPGLIAHFERMADSLAIALLQRQTEEALRESEERFRKLFKCHTAVKLVIDPDTGTIIDANDAAVRFYGWTIEELRQMRIQQINTLPPEAVKAIMEKVVLSKSARFEFRHRRADGSIRDVEVFSNKIETAGKGLLYSIIQDITERKQAEEALRESEKLYRSLFENMLNGFAYCRMLFKDGKPRDFIYLAVNDAFESLTGLKDVVGRKVTEVIPGIREADPRLLEIYGRVAMTGRPERFEIFVKALRMWFSISVYSPAHEHFVAVFDVITDRKQAEEALQKSEERYRTVADFTYDWEYWMSPDRRFIYCSPACERITGYRAGEFEKNPDLLKTIIHPDDRDQFVHHMGVISPGPESYEQEVRIFSRSGEERWIAHVCRIVRGRDGTFLGRRASNRDITERKQAEKEKAGLEAQLQQAQKMESVGRLAGGVAHDFNNMLGIILGHAEMALNRVNPAQPLHADLEEIRKAANRSVDLTRQLLAFARKQTIAPRTLDLNETVEGMLKMLRRLIGEDIDLAWLPGKNPWQVNVDPSQIDQILANLSVNARDAISGIGKMTIETGNSFFDADYCVAHPGFTPGEYAMLAVSDNGCGMDKETQAHIFEPFFTTKEMGKGTGLGLATVYGIVRQNNGFINVYSEPEQGTTFRIYLPRHAGKAEQIRKEAPGEPAARGHETILLVEDERAILKMTTMMLEMQGYAVLAANTPGDAIRLAEAYPGEIHLIMTDVVMPEMNGRDLARNLLSRYPNLKRLFMSGYTANVIAHHGVLDPGVNFIQKPFSMKGLTARIREVLDNKKDHPS
ncbi:MAG: PAS domain S-box protein [Deltaproteobacteria bacterium]|nr:PAS domain S-box protein [Deltaproteobacteria bacterium]